MTTTINGSQVIWSLRKAEETIPLYEACLCVDLFSSGVVFYPRFPPCEHIYTTSSFVAWISEKYRAEFVTHDYQGCSRRQITHAVHLLTQ